ncbi:MAG: hypothetical protein ABSH05_13855 [Bryobacteraceae bacterium]
MTARRQEPISEHQIGVAVFGRPAGYDSVADTIVRVQVSQLRRRLEHYFLTHGQNEPAVMEIPGGPYVPVFRFREQAHAEEPVVSPPGPSPSWTTFELLRLYAPS